MEYGNNTYVEPNSSITNCLELPGRLKLKVLSNNHNYYIFERGQNQ